MKWLARRPDTKSSSWCGATVLRARSGPAINCTLPTWRQRRASASNSFSLRRPSANTRRNTSPCAAALARGVRRAHRRSAAR